MSGHQVLLTSPSALPDAWVFADLGQGDEKRGAAFGVTRLCAVAAPIIARINDLVIGVVSECERPSNKYIFGGGHAWLRYGTHNKMKPGAHAQARLPGRPVVPAGDQYHILATPAPYTASTTSWGLSAAALPGRRAERRARSQVQTAADLKAQGLHAQARDSQGPAPGRSARISALLPI